MEHENDHIKKSIERKFCARFEGIISPRFSGLDIETPPDPKELKQWNRGNVIFEFGIGSSYTGQWNRLGMHGEGVYKTATDTVYKVPMKDSILQGKGTMYLPNSMQIRGVWKDGILTKPRIYFPEGTEITDSYCQMPDRRYIGEREEPFRPKLTSKEPTRRVPDGCYDTGDGFYNPNIKCVVDYENISRPIRIPKCKEVEWIIEHCRTSDVHVGYRPDLYENNFKFPKEDLSGCNCSCKICLLKYMNNLCNKSPN